MDGRGLVLLSLLAVIAGARVRHGSHGVVRRSRLRPQDDFPIVSLKALLDAWKPGPFTPDLVRAAVFGHDTPLVFVCADGGFLCRACVKENLADILDATLERGTNPQWEIAGVQLPDDTPLRSDQEESICAHCNRAIEIIEAPWP
jgi:hypothetical protein